MFNRVQPSFSLDVVGDHTQATVVPQGELDLLTVPMVDNTITELVRHGFKQIVLDLRGLTFMDSTGIRLLIGADAEARRNGHGFSIIDGTPAVDRVLALAGLATHFDRHVPPGDRARPGDAV